MKIDFNVSLEDEMLILIEHGICVGKLAYAVAKELGLTEEECYELSIAGVVHDIGKLQLNRQIYNKKKELTKDERKYLRMHSSLSYNVLKEQDFSRFILDSILYHHENYDGTGYPNKLKGKEIPIGARILRVCDVYSALTMDRSYRKGFDKETAIRMMIDENKHFDLKVFIAFQNIVNAKEDKQISYTGYNLLSLIQAHA